MKSFATAVALQSACVSVLAQSGLIISSPAALVQCQPVLISWSGGTAPYYISVLPGGQASAAALESFPTQNGNSLTWTVDLSAGQEITLKVVDSTGAINYSSPVPIQAGSSTSCSGGVSAGSSAGAGAAAVTTTSSTRQAAAATTSSMTTSVRNAATTTTTSASNTQNAQAANASPSQTQIGGAAGKAVTNLAGLAGIAGLVALLA